MPFKKIQGKKGAKATDKKMPIDPKEKAKMLKEEAKKKKKK